MLNLHFTRIDFLTFSIKDIKVKEQTIENMMRKRPVYEPPRFMTVCQAADQLMETVSSHPKNGKRCVSKKPTGISNIILN